MSQYIASCNKSILLYSVQLTIDKTFSIVIIRYKELILVPFELHYNEFHYNEIPLYIYVHIHPCFNISIMGIYIYFLLTIKYYTVQVTNLYTDANDSQNNHNQVY